MKTKAFGLSRVTSALLALIIAFAAGFSCLSLTAHALDQTAARQGVVPVVFYVKDPVILYIAVNPLTGDLIQPIGQKSIGSEAQLSHGSGFFVGKPGENPQYVVTNHHVVSDYVEAGEGGQCQIYAGLTTVNDIPAAVFYTGSSCEMRVYYDQDDYDVAYIDCYGDQEKVDLAVLKLRNPTEKRKALKIAPVSDDNVGDTVYTIGYPGNADNNFTSASKYGVNDSSVHKGSIVRFAMNDKGVERISTDATIQHGNSGGPLVNENGYVIGVNTNVESNSPYSDQIEADYYSLSSATLKDFLDKNNIPYEKAGGSGFNPLPIIIIAAAVVVMGAVVAVVLVMNKKKSKASANNAPERVPAAAGNGGGTPRASQDSAQKKAVIRSMAAQHNGKAFPVGKAPVVIGRNPGSCVIVFQEGTQGVSGTHCSISFDSATNMFTLTDLGSTYGTFLIGGQKLTPNSPVALKAGDSFYIGDKANVLRVEVTQ